MPITSITEVHLSIIKNQLLWTSSQEVSSKSQVVTNCGLDIINYTITVHLCDSNIPSCMYNAHYYSVCGYSSG